MDRSTIKKAIAYERDGEKSIVQQTAGSSMMGSISSGFKNGVEKVGDFFTPPTAPKEENDPTSLATKASPGPDLYVAMARLSEHQGNLEKANQEYQQALKLSPNHVDALVGLGRLWDRQGRMDEAVKYYQKAIKAYPKEATIYNDLGLCYARQRQYKESIAVLNQAVQLQPKSKLYRNNLATVLVENGDNDGAFVQLVAAHGQAGACYNLGILLYKKGQYDLAAKLFVKAKEKDPAMVEAVPWLEQSRRALASRPALEPARNVATANRPAQAAPSAQLPMRPAATVAAPPAAAAPTVLQARRSTPASSGIRQLPPVTSSSTQAGAERAPMPPSLESDGPSLAGQGASTKPTRTPPTTAPSTTAPVAPLPPMLR